MHEITGIETTRNTLILYIFNKHGDTIHLTSMVVQFGIQIPVAEVQMIVYNGTTVSSTGSA